MLGLLLAFMCASCSHRVVDNIRYQRDTTFIERVRVDSTVRRDSVDIRKKGDTIFIYKDRLLEKYRIIRDTIRHVTLDSIVVEREKRVEVEKPLSLASRIKISLFWWIFAAAAIFGGWTFRKPLFEILKTIIKL